VTAAYLYNIEDILGFLPHRYPFLLVDRVLALDPAKTISALKNVTYNEEFFQGHFPDLRIMPGVLVVEAIAQAGGILLFHSIPDPEKKFVLFSKIENLRFRRPVVPGDQIRLDVELLKVKGRFFQFHGRALVEGDVVVDGKMMASLVGREELNARR
jgi:3-hydroxyacyl-[acyl-carrier-protein] dehydratase/UDP-3-O-[3-hydroxymyristoyl] N-acetylglucosamine deacetylase/3-hydroxyacyl-[acyl-carrier-protein] dehydratase